MLKKRYAVGKCGNKTKCGIRWYANKREAEAAAARIEKRDPIGHANGDYYFYGPLTEREKEMNKDDVARMERLRLEAEVLRRGTMDLNKLYAETKQALDRVGAARAHADEQLLVYKTAFKIISALLDKQGEIK